MTEPLFASYVFIRFDYEAGPSFTTVRSTRGVVDFIRRGAHPQEVSPDLIAEIKEYEGLKNQVLDRTLPKEGQQVRIKEGQFTDIEAIYKEPDGEKRSILLITMMNQQIPVSIENKHIDLN